jgi:hypothetical protein
MAPSLLEIWVYHNKYTSLKARSSSIHELAIWSSLLARAAIFVIEMTFRGEVSRHEKNAFL